MFVSLIGTCRMNSVSLCCEGFLPPSTCPEINFEDEHLVSFSFFQEVEDRYENIKVEVKEKEDISKEDI